MSLYHPDLEGDTFFWQAGPVGVLLLHGFTATTSEVRQFAPRLLDAGYTVSGPLLPGHGTTLRDANRQRWQDWACCAEEAYCALQEKCSRVFIAGESLGGALSLYIASLHPDAAGAMVYAPALRITRNPVMIAALRLITPFVESIPKKQLNPSPYWQGYPANPLKAADQMLKLQKEVWKRLPLITMPLLVVQGKLDTTVAPSVPEDICRGVRSRIKEVHWMEHTPHCVLIEDELDEVTQISLAFMQKALDRYDERNLPKNT